MLSEGFGNPDLLVTYVEALFVEIVLEGVHSSELKELRLEDVPVEPGELVRRHQLLVSVCAGFPASACAFYVLSWGGERRLSGLL